jgi:methionyl-tRNA formyltransferase
LRLPKYRGAAPINWAVLRGETVTGNSIIRLANKMDAGAILAQSELAIGEAETAGELHDRLALDGAPLVLRVLDDLSSSTAAEREQDHAASTMAPKLSRETATIDWTQPANAVARRINGLSPWPGCRVALIDARGESIARLTLLRARSASGKIGDIAPGNLADSGVIATGNTAAVEILDVHPEGKRPMSLHDYRLGHRWVSGLRVESVV